MCTSHTYVPCIHGIRKEIVDCWVSLDEEMLENGIVPETEIWRTIQIYWESSWLLSSVKIYGKGGGGGNGWYTLKEKKGSTQHHFCHNVGIIWEGVYQHLTFKGCSIAPFKENSAHHKKVVLLRNFLMSKWCLTVLLVIMVALLWQRWALFFLLTV